MDRYGAHGELLAEQYDRIVGEFVVPAGVDEVTEFNLDGTMTIHRKGSKETRKVHTWTDRALQLTREVWLKEVRRKFEDGVYGYRPERFDEDIEILRTRCYGDLSTDDEAWIAWAREHIDLLDECTGEVVGLWRPKVVEIGAPDVARKKSEGVA